MDTKLFKLMSWSISDALRSATKLAAKIKYSWKSFIFNVGVWCISAIDIKFESMRRLTKFWKGCLLGSALKSTS